MCIGPLASKKPKALPLPPPPPPPKQIAPPADPADTSAAKTAKARKKGTSSLQIPLGSFGGTAGLNLPG